MAQRIIVADRRREPRIPVGIRVVVSDGARRSEGFATDASLRGLQIELWRAAPIMGRDVVLSLRLPGAGTVDVPARVVHRSPGAGACVVMGVHLGAPAPGVSPGRATIRRPAAPVAGRRPRAVVMADLCALGSEAFELWVLDPAAAVPPGLAGWLARLGEELGGEAPPVPATVRGLIDAIAALAARRR